MVSSSFSSTKETGRATKGAALALKARVLLYAASPLNNPGNNVVLWQNAAKAAKAVIDLNTYALSPSYSTVVNNPALAPGGELILERREAASNGFETRNFPIGYQGGKLLDPSCGSGGFLFAAVQRLKASGLKGKKLIKAVAEERLVFHVPLRGSLPSLFFIAVFGALSFSGLGLLVGSRAKTVEAVSGLASGL